MSVEGTHKQLTVTATDDLSIAGARYKAITLGGAIAASTSRAAGVLITSTRSGEFASAIYEGFVKVIAGATVTTLGYPLTITTSGFFIAASSGGSHCGRALAAAASGDLIPAFVDFTTVPAWPGT